MSTSNNASNSSSNASTSTSKPASASGKLWGGRFSGDTDPVFEAFNASIGFDKQLWRADIRGSQAYARALARAGVLTDAEATTLVDGLTKVEAEWHDNTFRIMPNDEDIHTANERRLTELVGAVAGKLHTGRSRNDQVATDVRLYVLEQVRVLQTLVAELIDATVQRAEQSIDVLLPGYTHLQPAQPVRFSHFLLSYAWAWHRDAGRLADLVKRVAISPLGSGALAGNPFGIDRVQLARDLGFADVSNNSMDAVCDRDFIAEFLFWATLTMTHISQISEDLIIMCSRRHVLLSDAYSTGSSLMPQKKNPDAVELLRGKSGRVTGSLMSILTLLKSLPRAYNKDLQEDKEPLFDAVATLSSSLRIMTGVVSTLTLREADMKAALAGEMLATDLAEYLVRKGVPFRETHHIAGAAVKLAEERNVPLTALTVTDLKPLHAAFEDDVQRVWDFESSVESRNVIGGTSRSSQHEQIAKLRQWLAQESSKQ